MAQDATIRRYIKQHALKHKDTHYPATPFRRVIDTEHSTARFSRFGFCLGSTILDLCIAVCVMSGGRDPSVLLGDVLDGQEPSLTPYLTELGVAPTQDT